MGALRTLGSAQLDASLRAKFDSEDFRTRESACFAAGWAHDGVQMLDSLRRSLDDFNEKVIGAAMDAIDRLRDRRICAGLLARATHAVDVGLKWMYIDAIVDVADLGDEFQQWPAEFQAACQELSPIAWNYISERVRKRRKKLFEKLKKEREKD